VSVVVTNPDAQVATIANGFTYTELPPTVTSISPNSGLSSGGTNVTITGANFSNNDANTKLFLRSDGVGAAFVDSSITPRTVTANGSVTQSATQSKFGGKSAYFDGNGWLSAQSSTDLQFGAGDFTIDYFINGVSSSDSNSTIFLGLTTPVGTNGYGGMLVRTRNGHCYIWLSSAGSAWDLIGGGDGGAFDNPAGWNHVAIVRNGSSLSIFINGTLKGSFNIGSASIYGGNPSYPGLLIGRDPNTSGFYSGYIDDFRITKGIARWTSNFTPPTDPLVTIGGVSATNVNFSNATTITATTPAHAAGATNVVVTNSDGQTGTLANGFTYNEAPTITGISPASGIKTGGDTVTINGTGFYGSPTVTIGGASATNVTFVNSTTITATTPAHAIGPVNVVVTNPDTQTVTATNGFTYTELPPTISSISPTSGSTAGGTNVTITGTNFLSGLATGGTITTDGAYTIHTFTTSGTFSVPTARNVDVLVVAGGGAGGNSTGGGGGGGGVIYQGSYNVSTGSKTVTVGAGGIGGPTNGTNGANSVFDTLTAIGGGGSTVSGGSGGGGTYWASGGSGTAGQGYAGGAGRTGSGADASGNPYSSGGGGGAGGAGGNGTTLSSGNGGVGYVSSISGSAQYYGGGGGGGADSYRRNPSNGTGGNGGGGNGGNTSAGANGTPNTGGGGGGGANRPSSYDGGSGGSGIVIVRYLTSLAAPAISFGSTPANYITFVYWNRFLY
jgi:hypothetical protein